jgi:hypothetical protein
MQRAVNKTIEEQSFSMWFAYIHYWATDVFSMGTELNHKREKREREWSESSAVKEEVFG